MAYGKSRYLAKKQLDQACGGVAYAAPATLYFALFTVSPDDDNAGGTEMPLASWSNYARVAKTNNLTNFPSATNGSSGKATKSNGTDVDFGIAATTGNITIDGFAIYDDPAAGNLLYHAVFPATQPIVQNGNPVKFVTGNLVWTEGHS